LSIPIGPCWWELLFGEDGLKRLEKNGPDTPWILPIKSVGEI